MIGNEAEIAERFAKMWRKSRMDAGRSQEWIAKQLHVSKTTVQNWENGLSCPNQMTAFRWFEILGVNPMAYYMELLFPEIEEIKETGDEDQIEKSLIRIIHNLPKRHKAKLLYLFAGNHGSSPTAILELMNAHLQLPLLARLGIGAQVATNYEVFQEVDQLVAPDAIKPDINLLSDAVKAAKEALKEGESAYSTHSGKTGLL